MLAHELTHVLQQYAGRHRRHATATPAERRRADPEYIPYQVRVSETMDTERFKALAMHQILRGR